MAKTRETITDDEQRHLRVLIERLERQGYREEEIVHAIRRAREDDRSSGSFLDRLRGLRPAA